AHGVFLLQQLLRQGLRDGIGHLHEGGDAPGHCRSGTVGDILLPGKPRLAEMHLVINGAGQQVLSFRVELLHGLGAADPFRGHPFNEAVAYKHIGLGDPALVHHAYIAEQPAVHAAVAAFTPGLMVKRILSTPRKASRKMFALILLFPFTRSLKVMGTSWMPKPASFTRYFISIWK